MKVIVGDRYIFYVAQKAKIPKKFRNYKVIWNLREVLLALWEGDITVLALPKDGTPGYDFPNFVQDMMQIGQIKSRPKFEYYQMTVYK